jgi:hypothetical protein
VGVNRRKQSTLEDPEEKPTSVQALLVLDLQARCVRARVDENEGKKKTNRSVKRRGNGPERANPEEEVLRAALLEQQRRRDLKEGERDGVDGTMK